ncbi:MAG: hypothetical protein DRP65_00550 [Planctomycetota bacterium]|nr:MAG: hypothetical protein DRP65_00550 [Planctomycetota bacterium]
MKNESRAGLNQKQIRLLQMAVRGAGLRGKGFDGRYRLLLAQYKTPAGHNATSCKQLNNSQLTDVLAICESLGWRYPGRPANYFRKKLAETIYGDGSASFAQQWAIGKLAEDLGWGDTQLAGFLRSQTDDEVSYVAALSPSQAHGVIEALKNMFGRAAGKKFKNLKEIQADMEVSRGKETCQVG